MVFIKKESVKELQSGFGNRKLRGLLSTLGSVGGFLSAYITVKNEFKDYQIGKLFQLMETERREIRKSIDRDKEEHQNLLVSIDEYRDELYKLYSEKTKLVGHNDRLLTLHSKIKENVLSFKEKSTDSNVKLTELGIIDQLIKQDINKFSDSSKARSELSEGVIDFEKSYSNNYAP